MRSHIITGVVALSVMVFYGCAHEQPAKTDSKASGVTTVLYVLDPFRTFQISGTDFKGLNLTELKDALVKHQQTNPGAIYEVLAEVKNAPEAGKEIIDVFKAAGVKLVHYWAPVSFVDRNAPPGKYPGHVDLLK